jgi:hypothetical protein
METGGMTKFMAAMFEAFFKALLSPSVLPLLIELWRQLHTPQMIEPSKPTKEDDNFIRKAQVDGWGLPLGKS